MYRQAQARAGAGRSSSRPVSDQPSTSAAQPGRRGHPGQQVVHPATGPARGAGLRRAVHRQLTGRPPGQPFQQQRAMVREVGPVEDPGHRQHGRGRPGRGQLAIEQHTAADPQHG